MRAQIAERIRYAWRYFLWSTEDFMIQSEWIQPVNQNIGLDDMNDNDIEELFMNHPVYIASNLIFQQKHCSTETTQSFGFRRNTA